MKTLLTSLFLFGTVVLLSQSESSKIDFRIGMGITNNNQSYTPNVLTNEINYRILDRLTLTGAITLSKASNKFSYERFRLLNLGAYFSPLKNNRKHDIRIGGGLMHVDNTRWRVDRLLRTSGNTMASFDDSEKIIEVTSSLNEWQYQIAAEYSYRVGNKILIGGALQFPQFNDGFYRRIVLLKAGYSL